MSLHITPEYSAVASRPAPRSIVKAAPILSQEAERVADVGCGFVQGTEELLRHHRKVYAVDTESQYPRIAHRIEALERHPHFAGFKTFNQFRHASLRLGAVYVINVLHTLPTPRQRVAVLRAVHGNLRQRGLLVIDVPYYEHYYKGKMTHRNAYGDGYLFDRPGGVQTFYRFSTEEELDRWAKRAGFAFDSKIPDNHHWVRIYRAES